MEEYVIGEVRIEVQNEDDPNSDFYAVYIDKSEGVATPKQFMRMLIADNFEDPERFVVNETDDSLIVCSRQHEAILKLALWLNQQRGVRVHDSEVERLREKLIQMQL